MLNFRKLGRHEVARKKKRQTKHLFSFVRYRVLQYGFAQGDSTTCYMKKIGKSKSRSKTEDEQKDEIDTVAAAGGPAAAGAAAACALCI